MCASALKLLEERRGGNAAGPREALTMEGFLDQAVKALGSTSRLVWIEGNDLGHTTTKNGKAIAAGLAFRPLAETVKETVG